MAFPAPQQPRTPVQPATKPGLGELKASLFLPSPGAGPPLAAALPPRRAPTDRRDRAASVLGVTRARGTRQTWLLPAAKRPGSGPTGGRALQKSSSTPPGHCKKGGDSRPREKVSAGTRGALTGIRLRKVLWRWSPRSSRTSTECPSTMRISSPSPRPFPQFLGRFSQLCLFLRSWAKSCPWHRAASKRCTATGPKTLLCPWLRWQLPVPIPCPPSLSLLLVPCWQTPRGRAGGRGEEGSSASHPAISKSALDLLSVL